MAKWTFEPGLAAAEFSVRYMMITNARGHFKNVHGFLEFGVSWNAELVNDGLVVGNSVDIMIDAEAILESVCA